MIVKMTRRVSIWYSGVDESVRELVTMEVSMMGLG